MPRLILCSALAFALIGARPAAAAEAPPALQAELGRIGSQADGVVGIAAWRLDGRGRKSWSTATSRSRWRARSRSPLRARS